MTTDIWSTILGFLPWKSVLEARQVCRGIREASNQWHNITDKANKLERAKIKWPSFHSLQELEQDISGRSPFYLRTMMQHIEFDMSWSRQAVSPETLQLVAPNQIQQIPGLESAAIHLKIKGQYLNPRWAGLVQHVELHNMEINLATIHVVTVFETVCLDSCKFVGIQDLLFLGNLDKCCQFIMSYDNSLEPSGLDPLEPRRILFPTLPGMCVDLTLMEMRSTGVKEADANWTFLVPGNQMPEFNVEFVKGITTTLRLCGMEHDWFCELEDLQCSSLYLYPSDNSEFGMCEMPNLQQLFAREEMLMFGDSVYVALREMHLFYCDLNISDFGEVFPNLEVLSWSESLGAEDEDSEVIMRGMSKLRQVTLRLPPSYRVVLESNPNLCEVTLCDQMTVTLRDVPKVTQVFVEGSGNVRPMYGESIAVVLRPVFCTHQKIDQVFATGGFFEFDCCVLAM